MMVLDIAILSSMGEQCGVSMYGEQLQHALGEFVPVMLASNVDYVCSNHLPVVIMNYHEAVSKYEVSDIRKLQAAGCKVILIWHASGPWRVRSENDLPEFTRCIWPLAQCADAVVAHEPMDIGRWVDFIPHGIPEVDNLRPRDPDFTVGTAGFPSQMKQLDAFARICQRAGAKSLIVAPQGKYNNSAVPITGEVIREWLSIDEVVRQLSRCWATLFFFKTIHSPDDTGQSGSARLGVAAQRPLILSNHRKFKTLIDGYFGETTVAKSEDDAVEILGIIQGHLDHVKVPSKLLMEQGWSKVSRMYMNVAERLLVKETV